MGSHTILNTLDVIPEKNLIKWSPADAVFVWLSGLLEKMPISRRSTTEGAKKPKELYAVRKKQKQHREGILASDRLLNVPNNPPNCGA